MRYSRSAVDISASVLGPKAANYLFRLLGATSSFHSDARLPRRLFNGEFSRQTRYMVYKTRNINY